MYKVVGSIKSYRVYEVKEAAKPRTKEAKENMEQVNLKKGKL